MSVATEAPRTEQVPKHRRAWPPSPPNLKKKHRDELIPVLIVAVRPTSATEVKLLFKYLEPFEHPKPIGRLLKAGEGMVDRDTTEVRILPKQLDAFKKCATPLGFFIDDKPGFDPEYERSCRKPKSERSRNKRDRRHRYSFV